MPRVSLEFDLPDADVATLIPSVGVYAVIYVQRGIVDVTNEPNATRITAKGTNAIIKVVKGFES